jgi:exopolyphosphatase/pppGpp-phosphohydrolase
MEATIFELSPSEFNLHIARTDDLGKLNVTRVATERVEVGASVEATNAIGRRTWAQAMRTVDRLNRVARRSAPHRSIALAMNGLSDAWNARGFVDAVSRRHGMATRIVSREEAAALAYAAIWSEAGQTSERMAVCLFDESRIEVASGIDGICDRIDAVPFGVRRLRIAFGAGEQPVRHADIGPMFSLVRLCGGPMGRRLRELGTRRLTLPAPLSRTITELAAAWGYADRDATEIDRLLLHALVPDVIAMPLTSLARLGIERREALALGPTLVALDAIADLLRVPSVFLSRSGILEGAILAYADRGDQ